MRADALRRREALIAAARELFLRDGEDVALETVAAHAGVGIATLYRNFPTRQDLADATACAVLEDMHLAATEAADGFATDPDQTWQAFMDRLVGLRLGVVIPALAHERDGTLAPVVAAAQTRTEAAVEQVLEQARAHRLLRADVGLVEFILAVAKVSQPTTVHAREAFPGLATRLMAMLIAGMRPDGTTLPGWPDEHA